MNDNPAFRSFLGFCSSREAELALQQERDDRDRALRKAEEDNRALERQLAHRDAMLLDARRDLAAALTRGDTFAEEVTGLRHDLLHALNMMRQTEIELQAMRSIPLWTRQGSSYKRLHPSDNPITAGDPVIAEVARAVAEQLADELYRRAAHSPTAQLLIARNQPQEITL